MPLPKLDLSKVNSSAALWRASTASAAAIFCHGLHGAALNPPSRPETFADAAGFVLILATFGLGDRAVLATTVEVKRAYANRPACRWLMTGGAVAELAFVCAHSVALNLVALYCWRDPVGYALCSATLLALNVLWLHVLLDWFVKVDRIPGRGPAASVRDHVRACGDAVRCWLFVNAAYLSALAGFATWAASNGRPMLPFIGQWAAWLMLLRCACDLLACTRFYSDVLMGEYGTPGRWA